ncbi:MAG: helix-turn-helix domain-containing protein, partial [Lentisphaeraceae bacterium]|nr:helix-turn-helix domain-containing protein [Lentisphaeraceae bacterium]
MTARGKIGSLTQKLSRKKTGAEEGVSMLRTEVKYIPAPDILEPSVKWQAWLIECAPILNATGEILEDVKRKADKDDEFKLWLATSAQKEISAALPISRSTVQRHLGHYAAEHKEKQQKDVLKLYAKGFTQVEIAKETGINKTTIGNWMAILAPKKKKKKAPETIEHNPAPNYPSEQNGVSSAPNYSGEQNGVEVFDPLEKTKKETLIYKGNPVQDQKRREVMGDLSREELAD